MCRVVAYLGGPALADDLLFGSEAALVRQTVDTRLMSLLNLAGFGLVAWDGNGSPDSRQPYAYRVPTLPNFDRNLRALAQKVRARALLSHVRGVVYDDRERVGAQNVHPFQFPGVEVALAQNGDLAGFGDMRFDLLPHIDARIAPLIEGTTDTEWVYALIASRLPDPFGPVAIEEAAQAVEEAFVILRETRDRREIAIQSPVNLVLSNGDWLLATRFAYDYGWYPDDGAFFAGEREYDFTSLWFTTGGAFGRTDAGWGMAEGPETAIVVASEPITAQSAGWLEVPEYSILLASPGNGPGSRIDLQVRELEL